MGIIGHYTVEKYETKTGGGSKFPKTPVKRPHLYGQVLRTVFCELWFKLNWSSQSLRETKRGKIYLLTKTFPRQIQNRHVSYLDRA